MFYRSYHRSTSTRYAPVPQHGPRMYRFGSASPSSTPSVLRNSASTRATMYFTTSTGVYHTGFPAREARRYLVRRGFKGEYVVPFAYRPFDVRWLYWEPETKLLDRRRPEYFPHVFEGNYWLCAVQHNRKDFDPPLVSSALSCRHMIERGANLFPLFLKPGYSLVHHDANGPHANLSAGAAEYLGGLNAVPAELFHHVLATL